MTSRLLALSALLVGLAATPAPAQFLELPTGSWANDVTPDGRFVVGTWNSGAAGFLWDWQTDPAPTVIPGGDVVAVSDDGTVLAGNFFDGTVGATVAGRWTQATGWQSIGWLGVCGSYSTAYDISGDGSTIVGFAWNGCSGRGFRWTEATGMQELMNLAGGNNRASAISGDGSAIGGFAQGTFNRTPAFWDASTAGEVIDVNDLGEVFGFDEDGGTSVGTYLFPGQPVSGAFVRDQVTGAMTELGSLDPNWIGNAMDISEDGSVVVGFDVNGVNRKAWVWTSNDGMISLAARLEAAGVTGLDPLHVCRAVSDDGTVVVGGGADPAGGPFGTKGFIWSIKPSPWSDEGGGTVGVNGAPTLQGSGSLLAGSQAGLLLTKAAASAPMVAWMSLTSVPQSYFGGTIHAFPFTNQFFFGSSLEGSFAASTTWPAGVPSGTQVWFQFIIADPSVIWGLTLSNAVKATAP